ncbi:hypothetical protein RFI_28716, partial [Reticulomyxa filosa]
FYPNLITTRRNRQYVQLRDIRFKVITKCIADFVEHDTSERSSVDCKEKPVASKVSRSESELASETVLSFGDKWTRSERDHVFRVEQHEGMLLRGNIEFVIVKIEKQHLEESKEMNDDGPQKYNYSYKNICTFWIHSHFVQNKEQMVLRKRDLDLLCKDEKHLKVPSDFCVTLGYNIVREKHI